MCALNINAAEFNFSPKIETSGFYITPSNTLSHTYGLAQAALPADIFAGDNLSFHAEYFISYDYFNKEKDTYNKLNRAAVYFNTEKLTLKAGRDFLNLDLNSVIYFGAYENRDLKKPTYFDGALAGYNFNDLFSLTLTGGRFDRKDFYGTILKAGVLRGFYFLNKQDDFDLSFYGAALNFENETFALDLLAAFNYGERSRKFVFLTLTEKYKGKNFSAKVKLKKQSEAFESEFAFGAEYLSPSKDGVVGYRALYANLDRGFIFGNLTDEMETLTYKLNLKFSPKIIKNLCADIAIYNFTATDKRKTNRDIASEIDLILSYQYKNFAIKFLYGYLQAQKDFASYATGFEPEPTIKKAGINLSYQF